MPGISLWNANLPAAALLGAVAAGVYVLARARHRELRFTVLDAMILVAIMAAVTAIAMPLVSAADERAKASRLQQDLHTLRSQIELYKVDHGGHPPLVYEGTLPQLTEPTDSKGIPGSGGNAYPHGPYLRQIPVNPYSGVSTITPVETFPPTAASGTGGWLYHESTGQIMPDLVDYLKD